MATTKKTTTKKLSTSKNTKNRVQPWTWRFSIMTVGIYAIAVSAIVVTALFASSSVMTKHNQARLDSIKGIYSSLKLDESYRVSTSNIFGDKRVYSYDKNRTSSSQINYYHNDTVKNTVAELDKKIKNAGFEYVGEPYPAGNSTQYHYKSSKGEYIRLTVSSKLYDDAFTNALIMDKDFVNSSLDAISKDAAPSNVIIKVNLNDNNE